MSKRKLDHHIESDIDSTAEKLQKYYQQKLTKHSLDSDEEDDNTEETYNVLHEDDIEGQEDATAEMDGEVRMTAFNMKEEMEEGHFDNQGHFLWKKENNIQDNWLDSLDGQVIHVPKNNSKKVESSDSEDSQELPGLASKNNLSKEDLTALYSKILTFLKPKETIAKALSRLGRQSKSLSSLERLKRKKAGILDTNSSDIINLTELADKLLTSTGDMDVYNHTYEKLNSSINSLTKTNQQPEFDMYADDFEEKEKAKLNEPNASTSAASSVADTIENEEVKWEYKIKEEDTKICGPFTSQKMQEIVSSGDFKDGVLVRKIGETGKFYTSTRIDFELYY